MSYDPSTPATKGESALAEFAFSRLSMAKTNRQRQNIRWRRNYSAWKRDVNHDPKSPWKKTEYEADWMSDVLDDITRRKLLAAYGLIRDSLMKGGKLQFMFAKDESPVMRQMLTEAGVDLATLEEIPQPEFSPQPMPMMDGADGMAAEPEPFDPVQWVDAQLRELEAIQHDQLRLTNALEQYAKAIFSILLYGRGWLKRVVKTVPVQVIGPTGAQQVDVAMSTWEFRSVWKIYWDMENPLNEGWGTIETARMSAFQLRQLANDPNYDAAAIERVITKVMASTTGPTTDQTQASAYVLNADPPGEIQIKQRVPMADVQEFYGRAPRSLVAEAISNFGKQVRQDDPSAGANKLDHTKESLKGDDVECWFVVANGIVIACKETSIDDRPLDTAEFEPSVDALESEGVPDALYETQRTRTGLRRALENGLKLASNMTLAGKRRLIRNWTGKFYPGQFFDIDEDAKNVDEAVKQLTWDSGVKDLTFAMQFFGGEGDLSSMIPNSEHGAPDRNEPGTAFELNARLQNAGMYLAICIENADKLMERMLRSVLVDNIQLGLMRPKVPVSVKAQGFTSFQSRTVRAQKLRELGRWRTEDPDVQRATKVRFLLEEFLKDTDIDPDMILKNEAEMQAEMEAQQQLLAQQSAAQASGVKGVAGNTESFEELQLRINALEADIEKKKAEAEALRSKTVRENAKAVKDLTEPKQSSRQGAEAPSF